MKLFPAHTTLALRHTQVTVAEDASPYTLLLRLNATDPDPDDTLTYYIQTSKTVPFELESASGNLVSEAYIQTYERINVQTYAETRAYAQYSTHHAPHTLPHSTLYHTDNLEPWFKL